MRAYRSQRWVSCARMMGAREAFGCVMRCQASMHCHGEDIVCMYATMLRSARSNGLRTCGLAPPRVQSLSLGVGLVITPRNRCHSWTVPAPNVWVEHISGFPTVFRLVWSLDQYPACDYDYTRPQSTHWSLPRSCARCARYARSAPSGSAFRPDSSARSSDT